MEKVRIVGCGIVRERGQVNEEERVGGRSVVEVRRNDLVLLETLAGEKICCLQMI
jgi:hypothetical protein